MSTSENRRGIRSLGLWLSVALFDVALQWINIHSLSFGTPTSFNLFTMDLAVTTLRAQMGVLALWLLIGTDRLPMRLALFVGGGSWLYWVFTGLFFARMFPDDSLFHTWYLINGFLPLEYMLIQGPVMMVVFVMVAVWRRGRRFEPEQAAAQPTIQWYQFSIVDFLVWSGVIGVVLMACHVPPELQESPWIFDTLRQWLRRDISTLLRILIAAATAATVIFAAWAASDLRQPRFWKYLPLFAFAMGATIDLISLSVRPELVQYGWSPFQQRTPEALLQLLVAYLSLLLWRVLTIKSGATTAT